MSTAFVFPGQGAQHVGMGQDFIDNRPAAKALFDEASEILGFNLAEVCVNGPEEELLRSDITQPAIFVVSAAAQLAALENEAKPDVVAGLSSGEWAALYAAGVVSFADAIRILKARGEFMQAACEASQGGMLAVIGSDNETLAEICEKTGIYVANFNSPGQTVLSGSIEGIQAAEPLAKEAGAKRAIILKTAGAFHSPLMQPAADQFASFLEDVDFAEPSIPVLSNVTGGTHTSTTDMKRLMAEQITSSVEWVKNVETLVETGCTRFVECGPGNVLSGLIKRIHKGAETQNVQDLSA